MLSLEIAVLKIKKEPPWVSLDGSGQWSGGMGPTELRSHLVEKYGILGFRSYVVVPTVAPEARQLSSRFPSWTVAI